MAGSFLIRTVLVSACAALAMPCAFAAAKKKAEASPWQMAESARQQLQGMPAEQRTHDDYNTVMDAYRLIYHADPGSLHAAEAIYDVGMLLEDEGNTLHQPKMLHAALGQFEFLRTQYPHSSFRIAALLEEARIAANGLRDVKLARARYSDFVEQYPQSTHIDEAQAALKSLRAGVLPPSIAAPAPGGAGATNGSASASNGVSGATVPPEVHAEASMAASQGTVSQPVAVVSPPAVGRPAQVGRAVQDAAAQVPTHTRNGLATVSAIRHWSTPTYTRVAIDLGDEVQYEAARVPSPDRIYFDLHGTRLAQELAGKSFTVTDDGFLRRIRAAQYSNDMTRVVLDVNDVTEYSAFLLPNPYRLIIDIHGAAKSQAPPASVSLIAPRAGDRRLSGSDLLKPPSAVQGSVAAASRGPMVSAANQGVTSAPAGASASIGTGAPVSSQGPVSTVSSAVPSTVATRSTTGVEVASLSASPDTERATTQPTSKPIAVVSPASTTPGKRTNRRADKVSEVVPVHPATPTADGERTLQRALGLKIGRIVIDPGHGGHDSGTLGVGGLMEKDVVLDVALRLGRQLHEKLGAEIIYTRSDDTFIPLETRTAIANKAEADLFISVHANSSQDETARGVETYYLNFTTQTDALDVAARENAVSDGSVHQLADLVKKIALKDKIDESREFASDVEQSLYEGLHHGNEGLKNRGVKKAPFVVLIGANMPSILTEISFVTNSRDAAQLRTPEYRERVAQSIYRGIANYTSGLSGTRVASTDKAPPRGE